MNTTSDTLQVIYVAANVPQAQLLATALEADGIAAFVSNDALQIGLGGLAPGLDTAPRVLVDETDAPQARALALQFEQQLRRSQPDAGSAAAWYQFTIRGLLFLMACVAIYLAVDQAIARGAGERNSSAAAAAVVLFCVPVLVLAVRRRRRAQQV